MADRVPEALVRPARHLPQGVIVVEPERVRVVVQVECGGQAVRRARRRLRRQRRPRRREVLVSFPAARGIVIIQKRRKKKKKRDIYALRHNAAGSLRATAQWVIKRGEILRRHHVAHTLETHERPT